MTNPLAEGTSSWARTTRYAELAWGMPRKKLVATFVGTRVSPKYEGRDPRTGEPVVVREAVALPLLPPPVAGLPVHAMVSFDAADHLDTIQLKSEFPRPAGASDALLLQAANRVAEALGIGALAAIPDEKQTWKIKSTRVVLEHDDDCFWFELTPT